MTINNTTYDEIMEVLVQVFNKMKIIYKYESDHKLKIYLTESDIKYDVKIEKNDKNNKVCIKFKLIKGQEYTHNLICESFYVSINEEIKSQRLKKNIKN